ncbi:clc channel protein [Lasallia pustulata]|uniref:Clc channel protein n=1 Tax=Lasallia pustulata TaxID=136370 RepID=A0A1W5D3B6_9LECA|nr:clc channel protein [Lasallia pustulata]
MIYYPAAGSGVAEVKVILSGFVVHGYLGLRTLVVKTLALVLSVASGLSIGKEGPYVHIATCVGNIACRLFSKYNHNDGKRREVLSASAAGGVAVAFGAPIGGVLFGLEEVSYYFPPKTLFRTFFCCIAAALTLKFLNPYGTGKIVLFEVRYATDWRFFEMIIFILLGGCGGALGALFIKASRVWAHTFRRISVIKRWPMFEVILVAVITGLVSFWNKYTKLAVTELLFELASPCALGDSSGLCPTDKEQLVGVLRYLCQAFVIKILLTTVTFGTKLPSGIYVPSMVVGGMLGRIVGHAVQYLFLVYPDAAIFNGCPKNEGPGSCVTPGVYALVAAGATMCGVTRLSVTLAVVLFELTGSLDHVLPFSLSILVAKWTADALEPLSIYDLLTDMNSYPFLDNKFRPNFTTSLAEITPRVRPERMIDISNSPLVWAQTLRRKLEYLHNAGELDGGLPIVRNGVLVGLIPAPDLEFALDKLDNEDQSICLMATDISWHDAQEMEEQESDPKDFTPYIDPAPVALDIHSPMDLVYQCFAKLGLRYICVVRGGQYAGLVHKKAFVQFVKELERAGDR